MLQPTSDFIFLEVHDDSSGIIARPENSDETKNKMFKVLAVGPGIINDQGDRIQSGVEVGDIVALIGNVIKVPYKHRDYLIARGCDVIAFERVQNGELAGRI